MGCAEVRGPETAADIGKAYRHQQHPKHDDESTGDHRRKQEAKPGQKESHQRHGDTAAQCRTEYRRQAHAHGDGDQYRHEAEAGAHDDGQASADGTQAQGLQ